MLIDVSSRLAVKKRALLALGCKLAGMPGMPLSHQDKSLDSHTQWKATHLTYAAIGAHDTGAFFATQAFTNEAHACALKDDAVDYLVSLLFSPKAPLASV